ncbi:MAG: divalent cation tolerance protein [Pseudomonadota bacterium]|nr:divalent-cation tolerance protein CutA [Rubrivivax sp.]NLZ40001.1 divalent-cation tolerance protein CutA [Comamonadaceae bacterium]
MKLLEIHTTVGSADDARRLADAAVAQRLAACVHLRPLASVYRWAGAVQHDEEFELVFKTTEAAAPPLRALLLAQHPYALPALYTLEVVEASAPYHDWVVESTQRGAQAAPA